MAFKEYTAEEACGLMPKELSKREKRFAMRAIRKAALKGYNGINFDITQFNADPKVIREYFTNLHYCCHTFRDNLHYCYHTFRDNFRISWSDIDED